MKTTTKVIALLMSICASATMHGADGTFTNAVGGSWDEPSNWADGIVADGSGSVATLSAELSADATVTLAGATTNTIGSLAAVNAGNAAKKWIVSGSGSALKFDKGSSDASVVNVAAGTILELQDIVDVNDVVKTGLGTLRIAPAAVGAFQSNSLVIREGTNYFVNAKYNLATVTLDSSEGGSPVLRVCNSEQKSNGLKISVPAGTGNPVFIQEAIGKLYTHTFELERMLEVNIPASSATLGQMSGTGGFRKTGAGTLVFGATPTFNGAIVISEGSVSCGSSLWDANAQIAVTFGDEGSGNAALGWGFSEKGTLPGTNVSFHVTQYGGATSFYWSKPAKGQTCSSNFQLDRGITFNANINSGSGNTFSGVFSGVGGITFTGNGNDCIFVLAGTNTYAGGTSINSVAVKVDCESALGTGDVSVGSTGIISYNAKLGSAINDKAKLRLATGAVIDFGSYEVSEKVGALYFDGIRQSNGVWGAIGSGCDHETSFITGAGVIRVGGPGLAVFIR